MGASGLVICGRGSVDVDDQWSIGALALSLIFLFDRSLQGPGVIVLPILSIRLSAVLSEKKHDLYPCYQVVVRPARLAVRASQIIPGARELVAPWARPLPWLLANHYRMRTCSHACPRPRRINRHGSPQSAGREPGGAWFWCGVSLELGGL